METYESLECAMFWPHELGPNNPEWAVEIQLPLGPEINEDPVAGMLTFYDTTMYAVLDKAIAVLGKLGYTGMLNINDEMWHTNYVKIDFGGDPPLIELNEAAIEEGNRQMGL